MNKFNSNKKPLAWISALLLTAVVAGCGGQDPILGGGAGTNSGPTGLSAANLLGTAAPFGIAATAGVQNTGATTINGDVVLSPVSGASCNAVAVNSGTLGTFGLCGGSPPTLAGSSQVYSSYYDPSSAVSGVKADMNTGFLSLTPPAGPFTRWSDQHSGRHDVRWSNRERARGRNKHVPRRGLSILDVHHGHR
jgi:hypothetical protein